MAEDETYQTTVYLERGGDRLVAGSGGTIAIESGGSAAFADSTTLALAAGATLSMLSGAIFGVAGEDINVTDMRSLLASEWGANVNVEPGDNSAVYSQPNLPKNARVVNLLASDAMTAGSYYMTSVSAGREVLLRCIGDYTGTFTNNKTSVAIITSGCIIINSVGGAQASMHLQTSAAFDTWILFRAVADDVWAVVANSGDVSGS